MHGDRRLDDLRASLERALGRERVLSDAVERLTYERDASFDGHLPDLVVLPRDAAEVSAAVALAAAAGVPIVPRGSGTGLAGGAVAIRGGVVLDLARMDGIAIDRVSRLAVVGAGAVTDAVDARARRAGLSYPPDPSSGRSSSIGGNIGTNAGGPHCFKYGVTTNYVSGVEMALAGGRTLRLGGEVVDPPGYDLLGIVVGSEGTLGVVTRAWLRLVRPAPGVRTLLAAFDSVERAGRAVSAVIASGLVPAAMEMMDRRIMRIVEDFVPAGLPTGAEAALIVDVDGHEAGLDRQMEAVRESLCEHGATGIQVARTAAERDRIWYGRKSAVGAMSRLAPAYYLVDVTVPRSQLAATLERITALCDRADLRVGYVFHAGDGNLHPLILMEPRDPAQVARVHAAAREIVELAVAAHGSITGEHGVALEKREFMPLMYGPAELSAMQDVKAVFDPRGVMNPGKMLPDVDGPEARVGTAGLEGAVLYPESAERASAMLAALGERKEPVTICGARPEGTGGAGRRLSAAGLIGVVEYAPDDLYVRVKAGTPLAELERRLAADRLQVAIRSPWRDATVGGLVAAGGNAPSRLRYGAVRDQVLAATVVLGDGRILRVGRPVVKNVAGYDLPKIFVGSRGALGLIVDVTLRLVPRPPVTRSLLVPVGTIADAVALSARLLPLALDASGIVVCSAGLLGGGAGPAAPASLVCSVEGSEAEVAAELDEIAAATRAAAGAAAALRDGITADAAWAEVMRRPEQGSALLRLGVPVRSLPSLGLQPGDEASVVDLACGVCHVALPPAGAAGWRARADALREAAEAGGGYAVALSVPPGSGIPGAAWASPPAGADLMRALERRWDPAGVLRASGAPGADRG